MVVAQWLGMWSLVKGKEREYAKWAVDVLIPFWKKQRGYKAQRGFYTVSAPDPNVLGIVLEVDFEDLSSLTNAVYGDRYREIVADLENYAENVRTRLLTPTGRTPDEILYPK